MTSSQPKIFRASDNPRPKFPFDDDPIDVPEEDYKCVVCGNMMSEHSTREIVRCALNEVRGES